MTIFKTFHPETNFFLKEYRFHSAEEAEDKIRSLSKGQETWGRYKLTQRLKLLLPLREALLASKGEAAEFMQQEMGKPISQGKSEIDKCIRLFDFYLEQAPLILNPRRTRLEQNLEAEVIACPIGVVLGIMPWNFPFWQLARFFIPNLVLGNTVLIKPALNVAACALLLEKICHDCLGPSVYQNVFLSHEETSQLIGHQNVAAVSFTGSPKAGAKVAELAGRHLKKCVLELGGSDAFLVLDDADITAAAKSCVRGRMLNAGQSCLSPKRILISRKKKPSFLELLKKELSEVGALGPLARSDLREVLHRQVEASMEMGAVCHVGGKIPEGPGNFYPPTLLSEVKKGMPAFDEELFGPVLALIDFENDEEAFQLANDSDYGLGCTLYTADRPGAQLLARQRLGAGSVSINKLHESEPSLPFGGIKKSGYGREMGAEGLFEFANLKTIFMA